MGNVDFFQANDKSVPIGICGFEGFFFEIAKYFEGAILKNEFLRHPLKALSGYPARWKYGAVLGKAGLGRAGFYIE